jgi:CheY-like chemotaxis protein
MNGILGMTQLAIEATSRDQQHEYLNLVKTSGEALLVLINDILDLSKIEAGRLELEQIPFAIRPLVESTMKTMAWRASEKRLGFSARVHDDVPENVVGDPSRLRQVLINLLGNAVKFTDEGHVSLDVHVETRGDSDACLRFAIADTGIGIPADKQQIIFEAFTQADGSTSRKYGGSGLGLAICTRVIEMMNGRVWVESEPDRGSTFQFTAVFGQAAQAAAPESAAAPAAAARPLTILLAEDNPVNRLLAVKLLEKDGHRVSTAHDGRQALDLLQRETFDVVLMDVQMPVMNGFEATAVIRETEKETGRHQHIIAITAHALKGDRERCLDAGMDGYVSKPLKRAELTAVLAAAAAAIDADVAAI